MYILKLNVTGWFTVILWKWTRIPILKNEYIIYRCPGMTAFVTITLDLSVLWKDTFLFYQTFQLSVNLFAFCQFWVDLVKLDFDLMLPIMLPFLDRNSQNLLLFTPFLKSIWNFICNPLLQNTVYYITLKKCNWENFNVCLFSGY